MIPWILTPAGKLIATGTFIAIVVVGIYLKGRFDENEKHESRDREARERILEKGRNARDGAINDVDGGLRFPEFDRSDNSL